MKRNIVLLSILLLALPLFATDRVFDIEITDTYVWLSYGNGAGGGAVRRYNKFSQNWTTYTYADLGISANAGEAEAIDSYDESTIVVGITSPADSTGGLCVSNDYGTTWTMYDSSNTNMISSTIDAVAFDDATGDIWIGHQDFASAANYCGLEVSHDMGQTWDKKLGTYRITCIEVYDGVVWAGSWDGLHSSADGGQTWTLYPYSTGSNGVVCDGSVEDIWISADGTVWAAFDGYAAFNGQGGISYTSDKGSSWTNLGVATKETVGATLMTVFYEEETSGIWYGTWWDVSGVKKSLNGGSFWYQYGSANGLSDNSIFCLRGYDGIVWAGMWDSTSGYTGGYNITLDGGQTWTRNNPPGVTGVQSSWALYD